MDFRDLIPIVAIVMGTSLLGLRMILRYRFGSRWRIRNREDTSPMSESLAELREELHAMRSDNDADRLEMQERLDFLERALVQVRNAPQVGGGTTTPV